MRRLEHIVLLVEPGHAGTQTDGSPSPTLRQFDGYDLFTAELQQQTEAHVELVERPLQDVPAHDLLLIAYHSDIGNALKSVDYLTNAGPSRPILLNLGYKELIALSELAQPAAIVPQERFARWLVHQDSLVSRQIYGLKSLADALAPRLKPTAMAETEHYCLYVSEGFLTLPEALMAYMNAYWRSFA